MRHFVIFSLLSALTIFSVLILSAGLLTIPVSSVFSNVMGHCFFLLVLWVALECVCKRWKDSVGRYEVFVLMALCLVAHLGFIRLLPALGYSGLYAPWDPMTTAKCMDGGGIRVTHVLRNQYWCNYEVFLSAAATIFGGKIAMAQCINALAHVAVIYPIFMLSRHIAGIGVARFVSLLVAFSPTLFFYTAVLTSENLSAAFMCFSGYLMLRAFSEEALGRRMTVGLIFLAGVALGISHLFKSITIVYVVASFALLFIGLIWRVRGVVLAGGLVALVLLPVCQLTRNRGQAFLSEVVGKQELKTTISGSWQIFYELYLGLNLESDGQYRHPRFLKFMATPHESVGQLVWETMRRDYRDYPAMMVRKFANIHGSPNRPHGSMAYLREAFRNVRGHASMPEWMAQSADAGTLCFQIFFFLGGVPLLSLHRVCCRHLSFWNLPLLSS